MVFFSIIIPTFNRANLLLDAINSIRNQSFPDWECIIVDDGSTDGTAELISPILLLDERIRILSQANRGAASARNAGILMSAGDWIWFLDADDLLLPEALATQRKSILQLAEMGRDVKIVSAIAMSDSDQEDSSISPGTLVIEDAFLSVFGLASRGRGVVIQSAVFAADLVGLVEGFVPAYQTGEDRDFLIKATACSLVAFSPAEVAVYRTRHGTGKSEAMLASGEKSRVAKLIYQRLASSELLIQRLKKEPNGLRELDRLCNIMIYVFECVNAIFCDHWAQAAEMIHRSLATCRSKDEERGVCSKLFYFLYYPSFEPSRARDRCLESVQRLLRLLTGVEAERSRFCLARALEARFAK